MLLDEALAAAIRARRCGQVIAREGRRPPEVAGEVQAVHAFALATVETPDPGATDLESEWTVIDRELAHGLVRALFHRDLAYDSVILTLEQADDIASAFIRHREASDDARFYTIPGLGIWHAEGQPSAGHAYTPLTTATFDTGVVAITASRVFMVWVCDED